MQPIRLLIHVAINYYYYLVYMHVIVACECSETINKGS